MPFVWDFGGVKYLLSGGDVVSPKTVHKVLSHPGGRPRAFVNGYGPTEAGILATFYTVTELDAMSIRFRLVGLWRIQLSMFWMVTRIPFLQVASELYIVVIVLLKTIGICLKKRRASFL